MTTVALGAQVDLGDEPRYLVPVDSSTPTRGAATAPITIVVFGDFECGYCALVEETLAELDRHYPGRIRRVHRDMPLEFHDQAMPAAIVARLALEQRGIATFWQLHDLLYANQHALDDSDLVRYGVAVGLSQEGIERALDEDPPPSIAADQALAAQLGVRGTPTLFIDGIRVVGALPIEHFADVIEHDLAIAAQLANAGVAPEDVYACFQRDASDHAAAR